MLVQQWLSFIWLQHYCYNLAAYPPLRIVANAANEPPACLSAPAVYVALQHPKFTHPAHYCAGPWALTSHFHPYPPCSRRLFSVALFLSRKIEKPAINRCIALRCPDFPPRINAERQPADRNTKISLFWLLYQIGLGLYTLNLYSAFVAAVRSTPLFAALRCGVLLPIRQPLCHKFFFQQLIQSPTLLT